MTARHRQCPDMARCGLDWRLGRVYFLAFLRPIMGTTGPSPQDLLDEKLTCLKDYAALL